MREWCWQLDVPQCCPSGRSTQMVGQQSRQLWQRWSELGHQILMIIRGWWFDNKMIFKSWWQKPVDDQRLMRGQVRWRVDQVRMENLWLATCTNDITLKIEITKLKIKKLNLWQATRIGSDDQLQGWSPGDYRMTLMIGWLWWSGDPDDPDDWVTSAATKHSHINTQCQLLPV